MKTNPTYLFIFLLIFMYSFNGFAQRTLSHTVYFDNVDGFSGYVKFTTTYIGFAEQLKADDGALVLTTYHTSDENLEALLKAGYDLRGFPSSRVTPDENYGYEVEGTAEISGQYPTPTKLHLNRNTGDKFVTPEFSEDGIAYARQKVNGNESYWENFGRFDNERVVKLYIFDFKNEIDAILITHAKAQKEKKEQEEKEAEEKKKKETASFNGKKTKKSTKKKTEEEDEKEKVKEKTLANYAFESRVKGDEALRKGNYRAAEKYYKDSRAMGGYVSNEKMQEAVAGTMATAAHDFISSLPDPTDHTGVLTLDYSLQKDFTDVNFTILNKFYWSDYFSFNIGIGAGYRSYDGLVGTGTNDYDRVSDIPDPGETGFSVYKDLGFKYLVYDFEKAQVDMLGILGQFEMALNLPIADAAELSVGGFVGGKMMWNISDKGHALAFSYGPYAEFSFGKLFLRYSQVHEDFSPASTGPYFSKDFEHYEGQIFSNEEVPLSDEGGLENVDKKLEYGKITLGLRITF